MPASVVSTASGASRRSRSHYRVVSPGNEVDETLLGGGSRAGGLKAKAKGGPRKKPVEEIKVKAAGRDCAKLTASELARIQRAARASSKYLEEKADEADEEKLAIAAARKERMLQLEAEQRRQQRERGGEKSQEALAADELVLDRAASLLTEEMDEVKRMNQMVLYSKCVTIRDAQLAAKREIKLQEEEDTRKQDDMMENERVHALQAYEAREEARLQEQYQGAAILQQQIAERAQERRRQEELRERVSEIALRLKMQYESDASRVQERAAMAEAAKLQAAKAEADAQLRKEHRKQLLEEVQAANKEQISRKQHESEQEREEDARIATYIAEKEAREAEEAAAAELAAREKELEIARLRAQQERASDRQAELDELRAQRAREAYERDWRARERAEAERQKELNESLMTAREQQKTFKLRQLAEMATQERNEFYSILKTQKQVEAEEERATSEARQARLQHKQEILAQIALKEEKSRKERQDFLEEGRRLREAQAKERALLEAINAKKIRELENEGVPAKYRAELERNKNFSGRS